MTMDPSAAAPTNAAGPAPIPGPAPVVTVNKRTRSGRILNLLLIGATILAVGGVAFAVGRSTAPASTLPRFGAFTDGGTGVRPDGSFAPGAGGPGGPGLGGGLSLDGTVKAISADSLTLTLADGRELTFKLDGSTTYQQATQATATDLAVGDSVSVKVAGGRFTGSGTGGGTASDLTASDVTVAR
jgi:hypothetical protein